MSHGCLKILLVQRARTLAWTYCPADMVDCVTSDESWLMSWHFKGYLEGVQTWTDLSWERVSCPYSVVPVTVAALVSLGSAWDGASIGAAWPLLWLPPDPCGSGCARSSGTMAKCVYHSLLTGGNIVPFGGFLSVQIVIQIWYWQKPPLSHHRGQRERRTNPDTFSLAFFSP